MIHYNNISYQVKGNPILKQASFQIGKGECCALIGHNGAGKTTLLRLLLGFIKPNDGTIQVTLDDQQLKLPKSMMTVRKQMGFVPEALQFHENQTGLAFMRFVAEIKSIKASARNQEIERTLKEMNIWYAKDNKIKNYSKGMRQRLGLAQALLGNPAILLMDEPASGLDPDSRLLLYRRLKQHAQQGNTVLFSSHALNDIEPYVNKIVLLNQGEVLLDCSIDEYRKSLRMAQHIRAELSPAEDVIINQLVEELSPLAEVSAVASDLNLKVSFEHKKAVLAILARHELVVDIMIESFRLEDIYLDVLSNENGE